MPDIQIRIKNLPQIRAAFRRAPYLMTRNLNIAIAQSVYTIKGDSQRNTPVDTGRLRASTYTQLSNLRGEVGTNANYDIYVHEGTRYMKARPYLRMAVEQDEDKVNRFMTIAVQRTLNSIGAST